MMKTVRPCARVLLELETNEKHLRKVVTNSF